MNPPSLFVRAQACINERRLPSFLQPSRSRVGDLLAAGVAGIGRLPVAGGVVARARMRRLVRTLDADAAGLDWELVPPCPKALLDAGGAQVGNRLYVVRGYGDRGVVNDLIFVLDLEVGEWLPALTAPEGLAHSHVAACSDGARFVYFAGGQLGAECGPAIASAFSYDTVTGSWNSLPDLPAPRYAGTMQLLADRLHFVGGAEPDRYTPTSDHWSLAVEAGRAADPAWRGEVPVPLPAMHRGSAVVEGTLYLFGGQQGDFVAVPGDPSFRCTAETEETYFPDVYRFRPGVAAWERLADLPMPVSHTDFAVVPADGQVHVVGGQVYKHPERFRLRLTSLIQSYDTAADRWTITGSLPYRLKTPVCGLVDGTLFCATGQRDLGPAVDAPGPIVDHAWRTRLPASAVGGPSKSGRLPGARGKQVVLVTHELSLTGAPLHMLELAAELRDSGASVRLFTTRDDAVTNGPADRARIPVLPIETALDWAASADLVIAGTVFTGSWLRELLAAHPAVAARLVWWIHENDPEALGEQVAGIEGISTVVFDSAAARASWVDSFPHLAPGRVIHPGNRDSLVEAAGEARLPWPGTRGRERLTRAEIRERLGVGEADFLLCCIGTYEPRKGQELLITAAGRVLAARPELGVRLLLVGFRNEAQRLQVVRALSPTERAVLQGGRLARLEQREAEAFYRAADAFVMNSQGRGEPFGRVTIEAMAFGLPVLGTDAGGTREILRPGETGLLHPVGEAGVEALAANILELAQDRGLARRLGEAGRAVALEQFSADRFFREVETLPQV